MFLPKRLGGGRQSVFQVGKRKYEIILEQVRALVQDYPGYRVRIAGHSLGGALEARNVHHVVSFQGGQCRLFSRVRFVGKARQAPMH